MVSESDRTARVRMHDRLRGFELPVALRNAPPKVLWARSECDDRLARLYFTPEGWLLLTDSFKVPVAEWLERVAPGTSLDEWRAGRFVIDGEPQTAISWGESRRVNGQTRMLPIHPDDWPAARFEAGCRHAHGYLTLRDLSLDVHESVATHGTLRKGVVLAE